LNSAPPGPGSTTVAPLLEIGDRAFGNRDAVLVRLGVRLHEFAHDANAHAPQARAVDDVVVGFCRRLTDARGRRRVFRIVSRDCAQYRRGILDALAQNSRPIARERCRDEASPAYQAVRRDDADQGVVGGGIARRRSGLLADRAGDEIAEPPLEQPALRLVS